MKSPTDGSPPMRPASPPDDASRAPPDDPRPGETTLPFDPAETAGDAHLVFVGRARTPWRERSDCPRNVGIARERSEDAARIEIEPPYRPALAGLERASHVVVLYWMDRARRDLLTQVPRHLGEPRGTFALRSPARPNPIALAVARLRRLDAAAGVLEIDMLDCLDGTPVLDVKPYFPSIDSVADATVG